MSSTDVAIQGYHAHVYFNAETKARALDLFRSIEGRFPVVMGRVHERPVGPHPQWSYQVAFKPEAFGEVVPWLAVHRHGLVVFVHAETADALRDHTDHVIWLGPSDTLDIAKLG